MPDLTIIAGTYLGHPHVTQSQIEDEHQTERLNLRPDSSPLGYRGIPASNGHHHIPRHIVLGNSATLHKRRPPILSSYLAGSNEDSSFRYQLSFLSGSVHHKHHLPII